MASPPVSPIDQGLIEHALAEGRASAAGGAPADYIPELARADPNAVALAICDVHGREWYGGEARTAFTLQSVSKVFALACVLRTEGEGLWRRVSMEPSGDAFHSIVRLEEEHGRPRNPLINAGAIAVSDGLHGADASARIDGFRRYLHAVGGFARHDERFPLDERVYVSECRTGFRNRALANYMKHYGVVTDPESALDTYFRQCSLSITAIELARVGLFLAGAGTDPLTGRQLLGREATHQVVALMATCGLYDEVGRFAVRVGIPAKSGVSGAILAVVPGRCSIACYGPALGKRGNSLAGMTMLQLLSQEAGLSVFDGSPRFGV